MKRLLSIELQKIWMNKASRVLTLCYFILLSLIASIKFEIGAIKLHLAEMEFLIFLLYGTSILILPLGLNFSSHCDCLNDGE
jgi:hypothetical protein